MDYSLVVWVISQNDVIKYILSKPFLRNRLGKWVVALSEFTLQYVPQRAVKGQVLVDFLADHLTVEIPVDFYDAKTWKVWFDGSRVSSGSGQV